MDEAFSLIYMRSRKFERARGRQSNLLEGAWPSRVRPKVAKKNSLGSKMGQFQSSAKAGRAFPTATVSPRDQSSLRIGILKSDQRGFLPRAVSHRKEKVLKVE